MTILQRILLVFATLALPCMLSGQARPQVACDDGTQHEMNVCAQQRAESAAVRLDALLSQLRQRVDTARYGALLKAQQLWRQTVAAQCRWESDAAEGGSIAPMLFSMCIEDLTWDRVDRLKISLCEGEGMTGPCPESRAFRRPRRGR